MEPGPASAPPPRVPIGLVGAVVGGVIGHFAFLWIARQGFYAVALPGVLLGIGCGLFVRRRSIPLAVACGALALALGFFSEWRAFPFTADESLGYFLAHLHQLRPVTWIMILLGGGAGGYFALGRKPAA
jgi:hypothetical protein